MLSESHRRNHVDGTGFLLPRVGTATAALGLRSLIKVESKSCQALFSSGRCEAWYDVDTERGLRLSSGGFLSLSGHSPQPWALSTFGVSQSPQSYPEGESEMHSQHDPKINLGSGIMFEEQSSIFRQLYIVQPLERSPRSTRFHD